MYKIKNRVIFSTVFLTGIIQATALDYVSILGAKPGLLLICVIFFTLHSGRAAGIKTAIAGGIFKDITSTAIFGSNAFGFCLCVLFLSYYGSHFYKQRMSTQILLCGVVFLVVSFIILFINSAALADSYIHPAPYFWMIFKAAFYTGCIAPLSFFILKRVFKVRPACL